LGPLLPLPFYRVAIKIGLSEALTFMAGFVFGLLSCFIAGAFIIIISGLMIAPGVWAAFIASNYTILFMTIGPRVIAIMTGAVGDHSVAIRVAAKESTI